MASRPSVPFCTMLNSFKELDVMDVGIDMC